MRALITPDDQPRFAARARNAPRLPPSAAPISPRMRSRAPARRRSIRRWLSYRIAKVLDDNCIVFDETIRRTSCTITCNLLAARRLFPQSGVERRLGAGRGVRRQARRARQGRDRGHRRRLLHVRHADPRAVVGAALQGAVHGGGLSEPQLFDRHAAHQQRSMARTATPPRPITTAAISIRRSTSPRRPRPPAPMARTSPTRRRSSRRCGAGSRRIREEGQPAVISVWLAKLLQKD